MLGECIGRHSKVQSGAQPQQLLHSYNSKLVVDDFQTRSFRALKGEQDLLDSSLKF
jgi:hypothetical protein